ncbi:hypothetical protein D9613_011451 [Agrocybe pediades]|uniref:Uncharacterized protein n=1 Tax=Agrocybe pediades TaxID=84607 RepID=A0A8H4QRD3_9AGAR|nr:hypothetical protein D9613_011451 [Agrocybe pediades]
MVFSSLQPHEKEAFFSLLDENAVRRSRLVGHGAPVFFEFTPAGSYRATVVLTSESILFRAPCARPSRYFASRPEIFANLAGAQQSDAGSAAPTTAQGAAVSMVGRAMANNPEATAKFMSAGLKQVANARSAGGGGGPNQNAGPQGVSFYTNHDDSESFDAYKLSVRFPISMSLLGFSLPSLPSKRQISGTDRCHWPDGVVDRSSLSFEFCF